jgi:predicted membrane metal-binding protein
MRTTFVNPLVRRRKRKSNPKRRRRRSYHRRRRNAGIVPFIQRNPRRRRHHYRRNPLILENPRRRRRRNAGGLGGAFNLKNVGAKLLAFGGGSAVGTAANIFAINKLDNVWLRNGVRLAAAVLAPNIIKGDMGIAIAGSVLYPLWQEVAMRFLAPAAAGGADTATEADLDALQADLEDVLDEIATGQ